MSDEDWGELEDEGGEEEELALSEPSAVLAPKEERLLSFEFKGDAREYFRVWIVNLCLTLLTFGVFSAWAKVRKKRYLYSHTVLDGSPFQYLGKPIPILKGRLVAVVLAAAWYFVTHFEARYVWVLLITAVLLTPWIVVRSAAFNARYSAFRNMTFHFSGTYGSFVGEVIPGLFITALSCGFGYAWLRARFTRYMVSRTSFGSVRGVFGRKGEHFVRAYLANGLTLGVFIAVAFAILNPLSMGHHRPNAKAFEALTIVTYAAYFVGFVYLKARVTNTIWNGTRLGSLHFECRLSFRRLLWIYVSNSLAIAATAGLLIPWAVMRVARYRAASFQVWAEGSLMEFEGSDTSNVRAAGAEVGEFFDLDVAL